MACTPYISQDVDENSLYVLLSSGFVSLQKAAFFMLMHLYENHIPRVLYRRDADEEIKQLQLMAAEAPQEDVKPVSPDTVKEEIKQMESGGLIAKEVEFAQDKLEFKNIPQVLIQLIDNPPSLEESEDKHHDEGIV